MTQEVEPMTTSSTKSVRAFTRLAPMAWNTTGPELLLNVYYKVHGGSKAVSALAYCSDDPSLYRAANCFSVLYKERIKTNEKQTVFWS